MSFKDGVMRDRRSVFLDMNFFGEHRDIIYNGETYSDVLVVLSGGHGESGRRKRYADHSDGLYDVSEILHVCLEDIGGEQPEQGIRLSINDEEGSDFFIEYRVGKSYLEGGILRVELKAVDE